MRKAESTNPSTSLLCPLLAPPRQRHKKNTKLPPSFLGYTLYVVCCRRINVSNCLRGHLLYAGRPRIDKKRRKNASMLSTVLSPRHHHRHSVAELYYCCTPCTTPNPRIISRPSLGTKHNIAIIITINRHQPSQHSFTRYSYLSIHAATNDATPHERNNAQKAPCKRTLLL